MHFMTRLRANWFLLALVPAAAPARAKSSAWKSSVAPRAGVRVEKVVGRLHSRSIPCSPQPVIVELTEPPAPRPGGVLGRLLPAQAFVRRERCVLVDIVNRGRLTFDDSTSGPRGRSPRRRVPPQRGFTVAALGWEFDVAPGGDRLRLAAPIPTDRGQPITGTASALFVPDSVAHGCRRSGRLQADRSESRDARLTVRDSLEASATTIPRSQWTLTSANRVTVTGRFPPGASTN